MRSFNNLNKYVDEKLIASYNKISCNICHIMNQTSSLKTEIGKKTKSELKAEKLSKALKKNISRRKEASVNKEVQGGSE